MIKKIKQDLVSFIVWIVCIAVSLVATLIVLMDIERPLYYTWLFALPLVFAILSLVFFELYKILMKNVAVAVILILFFVRMVISPMFMTIGGYSVTITFNIENNTPKAILLVIYEAVAVFITLFVLNLRRQKHHKKGNQNNKYLAIENKIPKIKKIYTILLICTVFAFLLCLIVVPQITEMYRTIFEISDESFTDFEDSYLVNMYADSFIKKFAIVTGTYLSRILLIAIPAYFVVALAHNPTKLKKVIAFFSCFIPVFFIPGAIAKSLIYIVCLLFLYNYMFNPGKSIEKMFVILAMGGIAVIVWWMFRSDLGVYETFSRRFSAYFSGVNVVSGAFNMPQKIEYKLRYFIYDYTSTMPYGNTIFGISHETIQPFFNAYCQSSGQIPTTIGMGYYYFGPIFAPLYSVLFAGIAFVCGDKLNGSYKKNPIKCIRYLLAIFYFSMGIIMYNIEILFTNYFTIILPITIIEKIAYWREDKNDT